MKTKAIASLCLVISMTGCVVNYPKDLELLAIKVVDYRYQAELPAQLVEGGGITINPYHSYLFRLSEEKGGEPITAADVEVYFRQQEVEESLAKVKHSRPLIRVEFSSKENLHAYVKSKSYTLSISPYFCERPDVEVRLGWPGVYWRGLNVGYFPLDYAIQQSEGEALTYYAFINVADDSGGAGSYERYDLLSNPQDVCFVLKGGGVGFGFESNLVVIPEGKIVNALKEVQQTKRE